MADAINRHRIPAAFLVRQGDSDANALGAGNPAHIERIGIASRTIVNAGEEMAVHVDQGDHGVAQYS
jgi:hypothetical protein